MNYRRAMAVWWVVGSVVWAQTDVARTAEVWDLQSDTWVATDALGRTVPTHAEVGDPRSHRTVGIFYFLWLGRHGEQGPFDITQILRQDPQAMDKPDSPLWGPLYAPHHWGESIFGYYVSDDDGVLTKHAQMLSDAGVEAVIFDVTNQLTYPESWQALCRAWDRSRRLGNRVPQIAFLCPFGSPHKVVHELWDQLYGRQLYPELWFRWEGKPLILADPALLQDQPADETSARIRDFFTFRRPQPDYFAGPTGPAQWGWLEVYPQHAFYKTEGVVEEVTVGVAQNAVDGRLSVLSHPRSHGRSFEVGAANSPAQYDTTGRNFAQQWRRALELDPPFIFITGWNEWIAGRFDHTAPFYQPGAVTFVDQFDQEHSRDIEPMRGGHGDNYYYQMVGQIRRYRGTRPLPAVQSGPIEVDGQFADWLPVSPEYRDTRGDPVQREYRGWNPQVKYVNHTGRQDLEAAKVSLDAQQVYFYLRCTAPWPANHAPDGLLLLIDADCSAQTGWLGYDLIVRRGSAGSDADSMLLERNVEGRSAWDSPAPVVCRVQGNELELAVPRTALPWSALPAAFDFKWADNIQQTGGSEEFTLNGDVAPNDRFNYRARLVE